MSDHAPSRLALLQQWLTVAPRAPRQAARIAYWAATRRRLRARLQLRAAYGEQVSPYRFWLAWEERHEVSDDSLRGALAGIVEAPLVSVLALAGRDDAEWLRQTLDALRDQPYTNWEVLVPEDGPAADASDPWVRLVDVKSCMDAPARLRAAVVAAGGEWIMILAPGEVPSRQSLVRLVAAAVCSEADMVYGDEDRTDSSARRHDPWFKPIWNEELALTQDVVTGACLLRNAAALDHITAPFPVMECAPYWLAMRIALSSAEPPRHTPHVVSHRVRDRAPADQRRAAVVSLLSGSGAAVRAGRHDTLRVDWPLPTPKPLVSVIIPTRDRRDLLEPCVETVLTKTRHTSIEILIVDNGSSDPDTLAYLRQTAKDPRVTVLSFAKPYNYSQINNFAVRKSGGEFVCLLNNDTQVISDDWLCALLRQASRDHVGAAGAKLLYNDDTVQHAGVVMGMGNAAGHAHRHLPDRERGYHALAHSAHYVSAVTAACLLVSRAKFEAVGGLDEIDLQIAYNDVDFCLKLQRAGWRNVYVPQAMLYHFESKSRGSDFSTENHARYLRELATLQNRWNTADVVDPMHHPRLDPASETYRIKI